MPRVRFYNRQLMSFGVPYKKESFKDKTLKLTRAYWIWKQNEKICFSKEDAKEILQILLNYVYFKLYVLIYLFLSVSVYTCLLIIF